jgi:CspA family cold shock protein
MNQARTPFPVPRQTKMATRPKRASTTRKTQRATDTQRSRRLVVCLSALTWYCSGTALEATLAKGTVKWFNPTKGYGFIQPMGGGSDVFVHISAVERAGLSTLSEGQTVEFEVVDNRGKKSAENLKVGR